jgi:hypothetical protein
MGNANDHARLHASSNASQYDAHTLLPLILAGTLLVLVLILLEKIKRSRPLIPNMPHLFFCNITLFFPLGPIARISLFILGLTA